MRLYYVVRDNNPTKKDAAARGELKARLPVADLEGNAPNRTLSFDKVDASGSAWFGGIDLDAPALEKLPTPGPSPLDREGRTPSEAGAHLAALLQTELRALLPSGERSRLTVEVVVAEEHVEAACVAAQAWLAANWEYPKDAR